MVRKVTVFRERRAIFEVDDGDFGVEGSGFGFLVEFDEGIFGFSKVVINEIRRGAAENTGNFELVGHKTGETYSGIAGSVLLIIGTFVRLVDDDETEVAERGKKC